jgi:hypothetical protein
MARPSPMASARQASYAFPDGNAIESPIDCRRLLMALAALDLVERNGDRFRNTELGRLCSSASDVNLGSISKICSLHESERPTDDTAQLSGASI